MLTQNIHKTIVVNLLCQLLSIQVEYFVFAYKKQLRLLRYAKQNNYFLVNLSILFLELSLIVVLIDVNCLSKIRILGDITSDYISFSYSLAIM